MSSKTVKTTERTDGVGRKLTDQPRRFLGLFLAPFAGLLVSWAIHVYVRGVHVAWGPIDFQAPGGLAATVVTSCATMLGAVYLAHVGWEFSEHRKPPFRRALAGSSFAIGALFAVSVGVGPHYWWSFIFILIGWYAAAMWSLARLNVTRADPRGDGDKDDDGLLDKLGLKGWKFSKAHVERDAKGVPTRVDIDAVHAPGDTVGKLQDAVPAFESLAGAPAGMSRATPTGAANRSKMSIILQDPFAGGRIPYGPPSFPGGSITDPITTSIYDDGHPVWCWLAGGPGFSPTGYGFMGMTRTGKTVNENKMLTEVISRRNVVVLYLNKAKGLQDVRPVIPGIEVAVISEGMDDGVAEYKAALEMVKAIITYRQAQLARFGVSEWSARCFYNPPKNALGQTMEPMPYLIVHVGEADAILERAHDISVHIASKGLSTGVAAGWSLQRASAESMPTGLRFNVGLWWCHGTGDEYSAGFALSDKTIRAGANPHEWGQRKPGMHYVVGPGIDEENFAKSAKTAVLVGDDPDLPDDVLNEMFQNEMLRRNQENAPFMARLDRGSAEATGAPGEPANRWDLLARKTDRIRNELLGGIANMTASDRNEGSQLRPQQGRNSQPAFAADDPQPGETAEDLEFDAAVAEVTEVEGIELYDSEEVRNVDLSLPLPLPPADDDVTFEDPKPAAMSRDQALRALHQALLDLSGDPMFRDPADPTGNTAIVQIDDIVQRYPFRTRPWFSDEVKAMATGQRTPPPCLSLEHAEDLGARAGKYRLRRVEDDSAE